MGKAKAAYYLCKVAGTLSGSFEVENVACVVLTRWLNLNSKIFYLSSFFQ